MIVTVLPDYESLSREAARLVAGALLRQPYLVLGLAAGDTPAGLYRELVRLHREEGLDFSAVVTFNLDEYLGLAEDDPLTFRRFMAEHLLDRVNVGRNNRHALPSRPTAEDCVRYERAIVAAGGIDLQILGIGENGHIAFNEPGASLDSRTRITRLSASTVAGIRRRGVFAGEAVPRGGITMGVGTILEARRLLLLASGRAKARAVADAVEGPVTSAVPASALQLHPEVIVMLDEDAASALQRRWAPLVVVP
jgi:glucosamine-6-phosphate deaminase